MVIADIIGSTIRGCDILAFDEEAWEKEKHRVEIGEIKKAQKRYLCRCRFCGNISSIAYCNLVRKQRIDNADMVGCGCRRYAHIGQSHRKHNTYTYDESQKCYIGADNKGNEFLISEESYEAVSQYYWSLDKRYFRAYINIDNSGILLHRFVIFGDNVAENDKNIDHINGDTHDCRLDNLRICTKSQNAMNRKRGINNTSGVVGVNWNKASGKWRAELHRGGQRLFYQAFDNYEDAVNARRMAEQKYFGAFNASIERRTNI